MEYIVHRIFLDMNTVSSQVSLRVKKGDTSRKICATLREGGKLYEIAEDCYAFFSANKPDGNYIYNDCLIEGNTITYTFTEQTVPVVGTMDCEIVLYNAEGQAITSPRFTMIVEDRVYNDEEIVSSDEANAFVALLDRADGIISDAISRTDEAIGRVDEAANRVDEALNEVRSQIAEAIDDVNTQVDEAINRVDGVIDNVNTTFANAFKGSKSGTVIQLDDVSPVEHIVGCKVRSKNLWNMVAIQSTSIPKFTVNDDGTVTINASNYACTTSSKLIEVCPDLKVGDVVTLSIMTTGKPLIYLSGANVRIDHGTTITITAAMLSSIVILYGAYDQDIDFNEPHTISWIQLEKSSETTDYVPYVDVSTVKVYSYGTNPDEAEEHIVDADGTIDEMTSVSPTMVIATDNPNALVEVEYNRDSNKVYEELYDFLEQGGLTGPAARIADVKLLASAWAGTASPYSQVVTIEGATANTQVDLTPSAAQLAIFHNKDLAFVTENENGVVTVYAIGQKPTNDYTIQATLTEVMR